MEKERQGLPVFDVINHQFKLNCKLGSPVLGDDQFYYLRFSSFNQPCCLGKVYRV